MMEVYGADGCFYCKLAKEYLETKGIDYEYIDVSVDIEALKMLKANNLRTIPQIFLDNEHIGGYDDLREYLREKVV